MSLKVKHIKNTFTVLLFTTLLCCCKKDIFDYRSNFTGNYKFLVEINGSTYPIGSWDTSYYCNAIITCESDIPYIKIEYDGGYNGGFECYQLFEDGTFTSTYDAYGEFETTNKLRFYRKHQSASTCYIKKVVGERTK